MSATARLLDGIACTVVSRHQPGQCYPAVADARRDVAAGGFVSVVGATGCNKSTLLNMAAGLLRLAALAAAPQFMGWRRTATRRTMFTGGVGSGPSARGERHGAR